MLEAVVEGFLCTVGELLAYSLWPLLYYTGWLVLKPITLGNYPPKENTIYLSFSGHSKGFVRFVGAIVWIVAGYMIYKYLL